MKYEYFRGHQGHIVYIVLLLSIFSLSNFALADTPTIERFVVTVHTKDNALSWKYSARISGKVVSPSSGSYIVVPLPHELLHIPPSIKVNRGLIGACINPDGSAENCLFLLPSSRSFEIEISGEMTAPTEYSSDGLAVFKLHFTAPDVTSIGQVIKGQSDTWRIGYFNKINIIFTGATIKKSAPITGFPDRINTDYSSIKNDSPNIECYLSVNANYATVVFFCVALSIISAFTLGIRSGNNGGRFTPRQHLVTSSLFLFLGSPIVIYVMTLLPHELAAAKWPLVIAYVGSCIYYFWRSIK